MAACFAAARFRTRQATFPSGEGGLSARETLHKVGASRMHRSFKPLEIVVYQDVLCAWCYVSTARLDVVRREFGNAIRWRFRPYPLRIKDAPLTEKERTDWIGELSRARKEPDGRKLSKELWLTADAPHSSIPALAALESARLQGPDARELLFRSMQRAGLELGLNVARPDITLELASSVGLDMNRFVAAWQSNQTRKLIMEEYRIASQRGVRGVPSLVIGGRWMLSGLREVPEYRNHILDCLGKHERGDIESGGEHMMH